MVAVTRALGCLAAALAGAALVPAAAAAGVPRWSAPRVIAEDVFGQSVGIDGRGAITATWAEPSPAGEDAFVATRPAGARTFGAPLRLPGPRAAFPEVSVAESGETVLTWTQRRSCSLETLICRYALRARIRAPGARDFGPARELSDDVAEAPAMAMNQDGAAVVAWATTGGAVKASLRRPDGAFGDPVTLLPGDPDAFLVRPVAGIGEDGTAVVAWSSFRNGNSEPVMAAYRPPGGSFGAPEDASQGNRATTPMVAIDPRGVATVILYAYDAGLILSTRERGGRFVRDQVLSSRSGINLQFSQDARGNQVVSWVEQLGFGFPVTFHAHAAFRDVGESWSDPFELLSQNSFPLLRLDGLGNTHLLWTADPAQGQHVLGGTLTRFGFFEGPHQELSGVSGSTNDMEVNRAGAVAAIFTEFRDGQAATGSPQVKLVTRPADREPPQLRAVAALEGRRVRVTARCDELCRARVGRRRRTLRRGKGREFAISLNAASRARLRAGERVKVLVRAEDGAGNVRRVARFVRRAP